MTLLSAPLAVAILIGLAVLLVFMALWILLQNRDPVDQRLEDYGVLQESRGRDALTVGGSGSRYEMSGFQRFLAIFGLGPKLALALTRADMPVTAAEFLLIVVVLAAGGFALGTWRFHWMLGAALALVLGALPFVYLGIRRRRRLRAFTEQLPDMLTLLVGGLRAGYGLNQALEAVVDRIGPPVSTEIGKVMQAVDLGIPLRHALIDAVERVGSDDFNLMVVAINIQYETGGNLAETLEIIGETIRDRLRMLSEIRVLTSQQRFTGYVLAVLPLAVGLLIFLINPDYVDDLFEPGWIRILPAAALSLQVLGFLVIRRIVDIEV
jgi:tight adherence protein B